MTTNNVFSAEALKGEIVLVTGASRGIGAAIFDACLKAGATVIGTATSEAGAAKITERAQGAKGVGRVLNVADREASDAFMKAIEAEFGAVTVLVNNAGITRDTLSMRMKDEQWDEVIETNLTGGFRLARACLRGMMKARHGRIISIASIVGMTGNAGQANYAAAKAGTIAMSKSIAREIGARGVTVNCVAPGFIATDGSLRQAGGYRRRCRLPCVRCRRLHHRTGDRGQRRYENVNPPFLASLNIGGSDIIRD